MNDRTEFTYGFDLLRESARQRLSSVITDELDRRFYEAVATMDPPITADLYLTCFCEEGDLLSQWRGYGAQDSRYCIQFDSAGLRGLHPTVSPLVQVIYNRTLQSEIVSDLLTRHVDGFALLKAMAMDIESVIPMALWCIYTCALLAFGMFKDWSFREEREWRAILFVQPGEKTSDLDFASANGLVKPFIPLLSGTGTDKHLPISLVIAGAPRVEAQAIKAAELMLYKFGYASVSVQRSNVPLSG